MPRALATSRSASVCRRFSVTDATLIALSISTYSISRLSIYRKYMAGAIYSEAQNSVARALTAARLSAGLKQAELAKAIGKHQSYISDIERGQRRVDILEFYVLARAMNFEPATLYEEVTKDLPPIVRV